jgi:hypothetical protein
MKTKEEMTTIFYELMQPCAGEFTITEYVPDAELQVDGALFLMGFSDDNTMYTCMSHVQEAFTEHNNKSKEDLFLFAASHLTRTVLVVQDTVEDTTSRDAGFGVGFFSGEENSDTAGFLSIHCSLVSVLDISLAINHEDGSWVITFKAQSDVIAYCCRLEDFFDNSDDEDVDAAIVVDYIAMTVYVRYWNGEEDEVFN